MAAPARVFIADPQQAGMATVVGDLAQCNLELLAILRPVAADAAARAAIDQIAARTQQALAASDVSRTRERNTRVLTPLVRLPAAAWGNHANIANIRLHNVPTFTGDGDDTAEVSRWIKKVCNIAQVQQLDFEPTLLLLIQASSKGASDYIQTMRDEGRTLQEVVQLLEMRYGDLCSPEEARVRCNNMQRQEKDTLSAFLDKVRHLAEMACRLEDDDAARRQQIDFLVESNIRRVLPGSVKTQLEDRVKTRREIGLPEFSSREMEKECIALENRRKENRMKIGAMMVPKRAAIRQAYQAGSDSEDLEPDGHPLSSEDDLPLEDEATYHLVHEIKNLNKYYHAKGEKVDPKKIYRKAVQKYNDRKYVNFKKEFQKKPWGARQVMPPGNQQGRLEGPPNRLSDTPRKTISELLRLANCQRGQCIQCGQDGHYMNGDKCALKDKNLTDRPCLMCGKGLHAADDCVQVYQQGYRNLAPQQAPVMEAKNVEEQVKEK